MNKSPTHNIWSGMRSRCLDRNSRIYKFYGGRGIKVCERWNIFENFYFDMGERPAGMQLDRIDCLGNYEPSNCRWATKEENLKNMRLPKEVMINNRFGKWIVIERVDHKPGHRYYLCRCDCGYRAIRAGGELRRGRSTQCINCKHISHRGWKERNKNGESA